MREQPLAVPLEPIPPRLAVILRPELPSLRDEILAEICRAIPEYSRAARGEYADTVRGAITQALQTFLETIVDPTTSTQARDELCRALGRLQVHLDAGLNPLDTAFRIGVRMCWRRTAIVARRHDVPPGIQSSMADLMFGYVDQLAALAREGYLEARSNDAGKLAARRHRLANDLLDGRASESVIALAARDAQWVLPEQVTVLALELTAPVDAAVLPADVLVGQCRGLAALIVPGTPGPGEIAALRVALGGAALAVGPAMPLHGAHHSMRWAARAFTLAEDGRLDRGDGGDTGTVQATDHLLTIWLASDVALARRLVDLRLAPLESATPSQRAKLTETLFWWLVHNGNAALMSEALGIHPQTVRYRVRILESRFGTALDDPEWRISTELALRALRLRRGRTQSLRRSHAS